MKKSALYITLGIAVFAGGLGSGISLASGKIQQVTADLSPFHWKKGNSSFSAEDGYNDGTQQLPGSLNYQGTTYIPIRLLAETFGYDIGWDDSSKMATIIDPSQSDDPASDLPTPSKTEYAPNTAALKASTVMLEKPDGNAAVLETLSANTKVEILAETSREWLEITVNGRKGYVSAAATDYRFEADRPTWERQADAIIATGLKYLGTPYQFGASPKQTDTFDCSSFTRYIFGEHSVTLPRVSRDQSQIGQAVDLNKIRKGDLLFFTTPQRKNESGLQKIGHVGVYLGDNKVLQTYRVGIGVTVTELDDNWKGRMISAKRVIKS
ncbi:SH3 domain-containing protein [Paenibacillus sp. LMG 31456]|uniref:SH3 domain-containing protein n=1 Tax=Paenibacillus foliorum TaxID=2654974 RepID=A0A972K582_9BACL|nr:NlpC/P60 family protein [Paenibacillus foliorum]NOU97733.1 SH3 domain-containing protein [Paenibacillus foliorum]